MIPAHIFIDSYDVQLGSKRIFHYKTLFFAIEVHKVESGNIQAGSVQLFSRFEQGSKEFIPFFGRLCFIGNTPRTYRAAVLIALNHFRKHPLRFLTGIIVCKVNALPNRNLLPEKEAHLFRQAYRVLILRIMSQANHVHAKRFRFIQQHGCIGFRESTPHTLRDFFVERDTAHKCRLPVQVNVSSFHGDIAEAYLLFHTVDT